MTRLATALKARARRLPFLRVATRRLHIYRTVVRHRISGSPVPPPHAVKLFWIGHFQARFRLRTLIETGTYRGATVEAMARSFESIVSIELDDELYKRAAERFTRPGVRIVHGDSARLLPSILPEIDHPCLFWLDGHCSGSGTAGDPNHGPLLDELRGIREHSTPGSVVLIDDARLFGSPGYPQYVLLQDVLAEAFPGSTIRIVDDMLQTFPPQV